MHKKDTQRTKSQKITGSGAAHRERSRTQRHGGNLHGQTPRGLKVPGCRPKAATWEANDAGHDGRRKHAKWVAEQAEEDGGG